MQAPASFIRYATTTLLLIVQRCGIVGVESLRGQDKPSHGIIWQSQHTASRHEQGVAQAGHAHAMGDEAHDASGKGQDALANSQHTSLDSESKDGVESVEHKQSADRFACDQQAELTANMLPFSDTTSCFGLDVDGQGGLLHRAPR